MDFEILHGFIKQSEEALPSIRESILTGARTGNRYGELQAAARRADAVKTAASIVGLVETVAACRTFEASLNRLIDSNQPLDDTQSEILLDKLSVLEASIAQIRSNADDSTKSVLKKPCQSDETVVEFETDELTMEIFAREAADLTATISTNLKILENFPGNRAALLEIRRSAHTLKGSAAIVGLKPLARIAHRFEDLLNYLSENTAEPDKKHLRLLSTAVDFFEPLSRGENSLRLTNKLADFYHDFDAATVRLPIERERFTCDSTLETGEKATLATVKDSSLIRVSLVKLDNLINTASEFTAASAPLELYFAEMERHIAELGGSSLYSAGSGRRENDLLELGGGAEFFTDTAETSENSGDFSDAAGRLEAVKDTLRELCDNQRRSFELIRDELMSLKMIRFASISARLRRAVSAACEEEEKFADLYIDDESFEMNTQILDSLVEPLMHLLRNAVAHGVEAPELRRLLGKPEIGKISLTVSSDVTGVVVTVADDGRGISADALVEKAIEGGFISRAEAEQMSQLEAFELVFLPGLTTAEEVTQISGRGIGMNTVKTVIERRCGGSVSISSEAQKGSAFSLRLPAAFSTAQAKRAKQKEEIKRVLIVDDSRSVRRAAAELIENAGWKTAAARDGIEAFEILHNGNKPPNLIITDAEMPRMNGYEFLKALKQLEHLREIPVVMLSSRADDWHRREAFECGADEYLTKPFDNEVLLGSIEKLAKSF